MGMTHKRRRIKMYAVMSRTSFEIPTSEVKKFKEKSKQRIKKNEKLELSNADFEKIIVSQQSKDKVIEDFKG